MKLFLPLLSILFYIWAVPASYSEDWKAKKWPAGKTNSASHWNKPIQGYHLDSEQTNAPTVYVPGQRPPLDLSESNQETVSFPQEAPPMTVSIPENPYDTVTIPNSNPDTVTPLPGYSEPEDTVQIPDETGH